jgi:hypothetical protein
MNRRTWLATLATLISGAIAPVALGEDRAHPIQVHVDMSVDPAREKEKLRHFEQDFKPAAAKFPGYIDVKSLSCAGRFRVRHPPV